MSEQLKLPGESVGKRLDIQLAKQLGVTRSQVQQKLKNGSIRLNGRPVKSGHIIETGDKAEISREEAAPAIQPINLPIIYQDDDILVIDKPAGLASQRASGVNQPTVADFAATLVTDTDPERPGIVHRLDRETSGLMVIAKHPEAKRYMQRQFKNREVHKTYLALIVGRLKAAEAVIDLPVGRNQSRPTQRRVAASGKPAITKYKTLASYGGYSLIEAKPQTGRTHQIRVHFSQLGHPIVGDSVYGKATLPGLRRQFLHASKLEFSVPSGKKLNLSSQLPEDLQAILNRLKLQ